MFPRIKFTRWIVRAPVLIGVVLSFALGTGRCPAAETAKPGTPWQPMMQNYIPLPGSFAALGRQEVRAEVGITAEQTGKLKAIGKEFAEAGQKATAGVDWTKLSVAERQKKFEEMTAANKKRTEEFTTRVEEVLTPEQKKKVERIDLRQQAMYLLMYAPAVEKLGLTDQQKEQLGKERSEYQAKMNDIQRQIQKLHDETGKAALEVLTPEQIEKLKELRRTGWAPGLGGGAVPKKK